VLSHSGGADVTLEGWILHDQGGRLPFAVLREGVGGRPTTLGTENAATSAAKGTLECRNKDVRSLICEDCDAVVRFTASVSY
jgi:hypothetical protein